MSKRTYFPARGDLVEISFQPAAGKEIDKRRPAIVISTEAYNRRTGLCLAVPVSTDLTPGPFWILIPSGFLPQPSMVLCDYIKSFDYRERSAAFLAKLPNEFLEQIVSVLLDVVDPIK